MRTILLIVMALLLMTVLVPVGADVDPDSLPAMYGLCPSDVIESGEALGQEAAVSADGQNLEDPRPTMGSTSDKITHNGEAVLGAGVRSGPA